MSIDWSIERILRHSNKLRLMSSSDSEDEFCWGVDCSQLSSARQIALYKWVIATVDNSAFRIGGVSNEELWLAEEKYQTLLIMKWG